FADLVCVIVLVGLRGVLGLPIAVSLASLSNAIYMIWKLQNRFGPIGWGEMRGFALRLAATCAMAGGGFAMGTKWATITTVSYAVAKLLCVAQPLALWLLFFIL